jgi:signal transduction histidine kinase
LKGVVGTARGGVPTGSSFSNRLSSRIAQFPLVPRYPALLALALLAGVAHPVRASERWLDRLNPELVALDRERRALEQDLATLGAPSVGQTVPEYGYQHPLLDAPPATPAWVQIDLDDSPAADTVVVIPALPSWQSYASSTRGFPVRWRLDFAEDAEFTRTVPLCDFTTADYPDPGTDPIILRVPPGASRRYLRLTVTKMACENGRYFYQLAEIMALSGNLNIAIKRPIHDSAGGARPRAWHLSQLVDGRTPLGPPIRAESVLREGFRVWPEKDTLPEFTIDLGTTFMLQQIRLHPIQARGAVNTPGVGFPTGLQIEVAQAADFSNARVLFKYDNFSNPGDNVVTLPLRKNRARYVRIAVTGMERNSAGFSEIEIYADGRNVARDALITATPDMASRAPRWPESLLNDGLGSYGRLIELPEWLREWERRRELRTSLTRLDQRREAASALAVRRAIWLGSGCVALGLATAAGLLLASRRKRERELEELRARLARDLHDEIGSNLAGIAMLSGVGRSEAPADPRQHENWEEIQRIAQETTAAMREVLWLIGAREGADTDLMAHLRLAATRILARKEVRWLSTLDCLPEAWPENASQHVFLFLKEALANVARHSRAKRVDLSISVVEDELVLEIVDDGLGFDFERAQRGIGLGSLQARAQALRGAATIESTPGCGTSIRLRVPLRARAPSLFRRGWPWLRCERGQKPSGQPVVVVSVTPLPKT